MPFDLQPTLTGERLLLRPLSKSDFEALFAVACDPKIWEQHPAWDRFKEEVFQKFFADAMESGGALVIIDNSTGEIIGSSRYNEYNPEMNEIEIGWSFLSQSYWGGTCNKEMKQLMLLHAFQFVDRVVFLVGPENLRSRKAMEKIGGIQSGVRKNAYGLESLVYEIHKTDYLTD